MKRCPKCGRLLPETEFGKDKNRKDGLYCYCKECHKAQVKESNSKNPERQRKAVQRWFEEHPDYRKEWNSKNAEKNRERRRKYYHAHIEECRERQREYYRKHRDEMLAYHKEWQKNNPERYFHTMIKVYEKKLAELNK